MCIRRRPLDECAAAGLANGLMGHEQRFSGGAEWLSARLMSSGREDINDSTIKNETETVPTGVRGGTTAAERFIRNITKTKTSTTFSG